VDRGSGRAGGRGQWRPGEPVELGPGGPEEHGRRSGDPVACRAVTLPAYGAGFGRQYRLFC
jgi:hypothetical protein